MPNIDFDQIPDAEDFSPVPISWYPCKIVEATPGTTTAGAEMWKMKIKITSGKYEGKYFFDNLVFSKGAAKRVKLVLGRLGIATTGQKFIGPNMVVGRECMVRAETRKYEKDGKMVEVNCVPFAGYRSFDDEMFAGIEQNAVKPDQSGLLI